MPPVTAGPVSMTEALERLLPHCENGPHKVAARLDEHHRNGEVCLLGGDVAIAPSVKPVDAGDRGACLLEREGGDLRPGAQGYRQRLSGLGWSHDDEPRTAPPVLVVRAREL